MVGTLHTEVEAIGDIPRIANYIDFMDDEFIKKLNNNIEDTDSLRQLISEKANEDFVVHLMSYDGPSPYSTDDFVERLARHLIDTSGLGDEMELEKLGIQPVAEDKTEIKEDIKPWERNIFVTRDDGSTYKKGYKGWSQKEEMFVERRQYTPRKKLYDEFNLYFGYERSISSLSNKKLRIKKAKEKEVNSSVL